MITILEDRHSPESFNAATWRKATVINNSIQLWIGGAVIARIDPADGRQAYAEEIVMIGRSWVHLQFNDAPTFLFFCRDAGFADCFDFTPLPRPANEPVYAAKRNDISVGGIL